jgi:hypothetical protein
MKVKLSTKIMGAEGEVLGADKKGYIFGEDMQPKKNDKGEWLQAFRHDEEDALTVKKVIARCLLSDLNIENRKEPVSGDEKAERFAIWFKLSNSNGSMELESAEVKKITELVRFIEPTLIGGQVCMALESK